MSVPKLVSSKDPTLHTKTEPLSDEQIEGLRDKAHELALTMVENDGLGIAAPQVGWNLRFFIMEVGDHQRYVFNPEIIEMSDETQIHEEGCLSFPLLFMRVKRSKWIKVRYKTLTADGVKKVEETLSDFEAQCFQHETDHVDGITFTQRVGTFTLKRAKLRRAKLEKKLSKKRIT